MSTDLSGKRAAFLGAGKIGGIGDAQIEVGKLHRRALLQRAGERAGERHLQPVEQPGDAEREHDQRVKASPRQTVEASGQIGFDDAGALAGLIAQTVLLLRGTFAHVTESMR